MTDVTNGLEAGRAGAAVPTADELKLLRDAVVDAAAVSSGLWFSYLLVLFYLLVGTAGVTQRDLLLSDVVTLPFLSGVQLPLRGFACLGPAIFVVTHAYLLLHLALLASKVRAFDAALARVDSPSIQRQLREELPLNIFVQLFAGPDEVQRGPMAFLMGLAASISLVIGPVGLLVFFVLQFLPSHDEVVTWLQRLMVVADLILLWLLGPRIVNLTRRGPQPWTPVSRAMTVLMVVLLVIVLQIVFAAATFRGERLDRFLLQLRWPRPTLGLQAYWHDYLVLDLANLSGDARPGAGSIALLKGRDLDRAKLTSTVMQRFDFSNARLRGAVLDFADLQGSNLNQAQLEGASLAGAKLHGVHLEGAILAGANLAGAQLQGANLSYADLTAANLDHASLQGTILDHATLDGAFLDSAQLQGASLSETTFKGASLQKAFIWRTVPSEMATARLDQLVTDRQQACGNVLCPWPKPFEELSELIGRHMSEDDIDPIVVRLQRQFLPPEDHERDEAQGQAWTDLETSSRSGFEAAQETAWRKAGCDAPDSPFVALQMIRTLNAHHAQDDQITSRLAEQLLQPDCAGASGIKADGRAALAALGQHQPGSRPALGFE